MPVFCFPNLLLWMGQIRMDTQNLWFKVGPIWDAELRVWDAKNFGPVSPGTHRNKFVKKSLQGWDLGVLGGSKTSAWGFVMAPHRLCILVPICSQWICSYDIERKRKGEVNKLPYLRYKFTKKWQITIPTYILLISMDIQILVKFYQFERKMNSRLNSDSSQGT